MLAYRLAGEDVYQTGRPGRMPRAAGEQREGEMFSAGGKALGGDQ